MDMDQLLYGALVQPTRLMAPKEAFHHGPGGIGAASRATVAGQKWRAQRMTY